MVREDHRDHTAEGRIAVPIEFKVSAAVDDRELSDLHQRVFGSESANVVPWGQRLSRHSILWVTAEDDAGLIGFANVVGDGGALRSSSIRSFPRTAKIESELIEMEADEAREFLAEMGIPEPGLDTLARVGYDPLGLQSYLTAGPKEARGWTIHQGWTAPQAAGVIHTDFQKGFIKAEIVSFDDLVTAGSMVAARAAGKVRMEGKDYVMQDGDVVEFRFNV